jgi:hypothetical protein
VSADPAPNWEARRREIDVALGDRRLIWFGIRGTDAEPLLALPQFQESYAVIAALQAAGLAVSESLEAETGRRVDLDRYDIDDDPSSEVRHLRRRMTASLSQRNVTMAYRPAEFLNSVHFPNIGSSHLAAMFCARQRAFEHKPWVEQGLREAGVQIVPWRYVSDEDHLLVSRWLKDGPLVLRPSRSSGGEGLVLVEREDDIEIDWPRSRDAFVSVSPFIQDGVPVNLGGCLFPDGSYSIQPPSVQLIGIESCTTRRFGYCGNDFGAVKALGADRLQDLDAMVTRVASWLHSQRYVGAFGLDALVTPSEVWLTEVNARFQGCSLLAARVARECDVPDLYFEHLAAFLGGTASRTPSVVEWADSQPSWSQVIAHNLAAERTEYRPALGDRRPLPRSVFVDLTPAPHTLIEPGAIVFRLSIRDSCTERGDAIAPEVEACVDQLRQRLASVR